MKVLILGATGFIGFPAAQAFVRAGHIVYGQTRSAAKAKQLAAEEIIPVVADVTDTAISKTAKYAPRLRRPALPRKRLEALPSTYQ